MNKVKIELIWLFLSLLIGFSFSYLIVPGFVLHPTNISILHGDPLCHYAGWEFYRSSAWSWPITSIPNLMYPIGTSVVFTDSFPLLSIILKLFSKFLPNSFNWIGTACVINSSLMFYSGSLFFRILRPDVIFNIIAGLFTLLSSVFVWRFLGHFALTAQWIIIFELLLIMKPKVNLKKDILYQLLLIFLSIGTHPYLAGMLLPFTSALIWKLYNRKQCNGRQAVFIFALCILSFLIFAWFFGWFTGYSKASGGGFGYYSSNLLALINPTFGSIMIRAFSVGPGQYEGYAYLGLGLIIPLIGIFFLSFYKNLHFYSRDYLVLVILLICYFIFGLSNVVQIGAYKLILGHADTHSKLFNIFFRASARFIWPVFYFIQIFVLLTIYGLAVLSRHNFFMMLNGKDCDHISDISAVKTD